MSHEGLPPCVASLDGPSWQSVALTKSTQVRANLNTLVPCSGSDGLARETGAAPGAAPGIARERRFALQFLEKGDAVKVGRVGKSGLSGAEVIVAALVASLLSVPVLTLLFQERDTGKRSSLEYLAMTAARDEMYETRLLVTAGAALPGLQHDWLPLGGSTLQRLGAMGASLGSAFEYHPGQCRIETKLTFSDGAGRLRRATLLARWQPDDATGRAVTRLVFGVLSPP